MDELLNYGYTNTTVVALFYISAFDIKSEATSGPTKKDQTLLWLTDMCIIKLCQLH